MLVDLVLEMPKLCLLFLFFFLSFLISMAIGGAGGRWIGYKMRYIAIVRLFVAGREKCNWTCLCFCLQSSCNRRMDI